MNVATRDNIKKNNKLSKVDWGINIISTKKIYISRKTNLEEKINPLIIIVQISKFNKSKKIS